MNKYVSRVTSSARGETFNPLVWPFLLATVVHAVAFTGLTWTQTVHNYSLYESMSGITSWMPMAWGGVALAVMITGLSFLLFNIPPIGKLSGLVGFMVWLFAGFCWLETSNFLLICAIAVPNAWFWFWQYLSLSHFNKEDATDKQTMKDYNNGLYDNQDHPKDAKTARENNRGLDSK